MDATTKDLAQIEYSIQLTKRKILRHLGHLFLPVWVALPLKILIIMAKANLKALVLLKENLNTNLRWKRNDLNSIYQNSKQIE